MSMTQVASLEPVVPAVRWKVFVRRWFYFGSGIYSALMVVWGFSHTVGMNLFHPAVPRPRLLWLHASVFSGWVVFYILQTALVRTRNVKVHRTLGWFGLALAATMVVLGVSTAFAMGRFDVRVLHLPGAAVFEIVPLTDMLAFSVLMTLAIAWRRKVERHRRLMFMAMMGLLAAAYGRFDFLASHNSFYVCVDAAILVGALRDRFVDGKVNPVYKVGLPALMALHAAAIWMVVRTPGWWDRTAHAWFG